MLNIKVVRGMGFALLIFAVLWLESLLLPNCLSPFVILLSNLLNTTLKR